MAFQFKGNSWTEILEITPSEELGTEYAQSISEKLKTKAIHCSVSDTAGAISYEIFDGGRSVESLHSGDFGLRFSSKIRKAKAKDIKNLHEFVDSFFKEQGAFVPDYYSISAPKTGKKVVITIPGYTAAYFERVDYICR